MKNNLSKREITVNASKKYRILIGNRLIERTGELINEVMPKCKIALITDDIVDGIYSKTVERSLSERGFFVVKKVFKAGEESKNLNTYFEIVNFLAENSLTRTDAIVALGGGVTGDMAGFASSTYLRGIKCVQIPTTLLSQIDSSVGGKTAVNLSFGKNLVGTFYQPSLVICDIDTLNTLPDQVYLDGMGECVKYALLDEQIFNLLNTSNIDLEELVYHCVDYKRKIVEQDEFEGGKRKLLNLGHTFAHGIEKLSGYTISHGKAVAMGLKIIAEICYKRNLLIREEYDKVIKIINDNAPVPPCPYTLSEVVNASLSDKKRSGNDISIMTVHKIGDVRESKMTIEQYKGFIE